MERTFPPYILALIFCSIILFLVTVSVFSTHFASTDFLLSMIISHLIITKNPQIIDFFRKIYVKDEKKKS